MYVEGAAVVHGYAAVLAGVGLRDLARRGFFDRVEPAARGELLAVISEIERAGGAWQAGVELSNGNSETPPAEIPARSAVSAEQAAVLLSVSPRRVRQMAPLIGGVKNGGRWVFERAEVLAEWERRKGVA